MPIWIEKTRDVAAAGEAPTAARTVSRLCELDTYEKKSIPEVTVRGDIIAYASPDSTYAVTKKLFDAAKKSILIGIYDFSAPHVRQLVLDAMARGVAVSLMLDIDSEEESRLFDELVDMGMLGVPAPSCANEHISVFASSHEKVIVIDGEWTLVQSGNYSSNSIPLNEVDGSALARHSGAAIAIPGWRSARPSWPSFSRRSFAATWPALWTRGRRFARSRPAREAFLSNGHQPGDRRGYFRASM